MGEVIMHSESISDQWEIDTNYSIDDKIMCAIPEPVANLPFICILSHLSTADNMPGFGKDWRIYWKPYAFVQFDGKVLYYSVEYDDNCDYCPENLTPLSLKVKFSGITPNNNCHVSGGDSYKLDWNTFNPNGTFVVPRYSSCRWGKELTDKGRVKLKYWDTPGEGVCYCMWCENSQECCEYSESLLQATIISVIKYEDGEVGVKMQATGGKNCQLFSWYGQPDSGCVTIFNKPNDYDCEGGCDSNCASDGFVSITPI